MSTTLTRLLTQAIEQGLWSFPLHFLYAVWVSIFRIFRVLVSFHMPVVLLNYDRRQGEANDGDSDTSPHGAIYPLALAFCAR